MIINDYHTGYHFHVEITKDLLRWRQYSHHGHEDISLNAKIQFENNTGRTKQ